ncbi:DsbA family protein [Cellulomonas sp. URHB0016]
MPTNDPRPTKSERRDEARAKALAMRKEQERKAKRNRLIAIIGLSVAVVALVAVAFFIIKQDRDTAAANSTVAYGNGGDNVKPPSLDDVTGPAPANDSGAIPVGKDGVGKAGDDDVLVKVYFDFMCPYCGQFDQVNHQALDDIVAGGGVTVDYHPLAFLDHASQGTFYSTRAANAAAVVADQDPEHFSAFVTALYANQPAENSKGLTDDKIKEIATDAGVPADVAATFTDTVDGTFETSGGGSEDGTWRTFAPWVAATTNKATTDLPKLSTPTILIDDEPFEDWTTEGALQAAVETAKAAKTAKG